jgi:hypothetical protein
MDQPINEADNVKVDNVCVISAPGGWYLLEHDRTGVFVRRPVVAWHIRSDGFGKFVTVPVCIGTRETTVYSIFEGPDGKIHDTTGRKFKDEEEVARYLNAKEKLRFETAE